MDINWKMIGNLTLYAVMGLLITPTVAIMASWNALPGEPLYKTKRNLERLAALIISPSYNASVDLELKLIDRRLDENVRVLAAGQSTAGLVELRSQIYSAKATVADNTTTDVEKIEALKEKLTTTKEVLEEQKQTIVAESPPPTTAPAASPTPTKTPSATTPVAPTPTPPVPTPIAEPPNSSPEEVIEKITETQEEIEEIIEELEEKSRGNSEEHRQNETQNDNGKESKDRPDKSKP